MNHPLKFVATTGIVLFFLMLKTGSLAAAREEQPRQPDAQQQEEEKVQSVGAIPKSVLPESNRKSSIRRGSHVGSPSGIWRHSPQTGKAFIFWIGLATCKPL